jgi:hypothetical protein
MDKLLSSAVAAVVELSRKKGFVDVSSYAIILPDGIIYL